VGITIQKGCVFDIKKFAVDDGPGIRTTVFLKGCPLRCWWCHNPEGQTSTPELMYRQKRCIRCGECVKTCPSQALSLGTKQLSINRKICSLCEECAKKCSSEALTIVGKETSVEEVIGEIDKDSAFYQESGGGITISGGEPLMQIDFTDAILSECKKRNLHTAVDTCGYASHEAIERIKDKVDLFLYDLKIMDAAKHRRYTGKSNRQILENFKTLAENGNGLLVRFPVIPMINDGKDNVKRIADFILSCGVKRICLLPYHRAGIEKYRSLGRGYRLSSTKAPSERKLNSIKKLFESSGLTVKIGG
jgi:pyruvate formate lyase activating enzyme